MGDSVEKHGEWETSCRMAFVTPMDWMQLCIGRLLTVYLGLEDLNSFKTQLWVWKSKDRH